MLDPCLKRLGIWDLFDHVWSCDDFNTTKSDPQIYQLAAEKIGRRVDEIIFVDDNVNTRLIIGIDSTGFSWTLRAGEGVFVIPVYAK